MASVKTRCQKATDLIVKGDTQAARLLLEEILQKDVNHLDALCQLGTVSLLEKDYPRAVALFACAKEKGHLFSSTDWHNWGMCLREVGYLYRAIEAFDQAFQSGLLSESLFEKGHCYLLLGKPKEASDCFGQLLSESDSIHSSAHLFNAIALQDMNQPYAAITSFEKALKADKDNSSVNWHFGRALLSVADWKRGWTAHEYRIKADPRMTREFSDKRWLGEPVFGKSVVLWPEQGLGDILQFCRFAPVLANMGASVYLILPQALAELVGGSLNHFVSPGHVEIEILVYEKEEVRDFDFHCPLMSLPYALEVHSEKMIPYAKGYLLPPAEKIKAWDRRIGVKRALRVGIVWGGHSKHNEDAYSRLIDSRRSIPLRSFLALLNNTPNVEWFSLQKGAPRHQLTELVESGLLINPMTDLTELITDWSDTAALLSHLDLLITVDTSVAHLAGAIGKPVWMLSRYNGCWRWIKGRTDTPWYDSMRIFHQAEDGNWAGPINALGRALDSIRFNTVENLDDLIASSVVIPTTGR
ncbi:hypothetical protein RB25_25865 [Herbaspirillum rubrisubalbicans]|uniref:tetratricopeptide repeat protein n=1 Tax=Herbaspirillum rubrisubalbicans TaxID=80842 RepID=UPI000DC40D9B|nr:tetratricopeptide repeat protein [Herbaspirillum rubrisubalbicans]RAN42511.1 hypothetical protein RB25_25865 [Herbaspirillum rubrisubalbicans]